MAKHRLQPGGARLHRSQQRVPRLRARHQRRQHQHRAPIVLLLHQPNQPWHDQCPLLPLQGPRHLHPQQQGILWRHAARRRHHRGLIQRRHTTRLTAQQRQCEPGRRIPRIGCNAGAQVTHLRRHRLIRHRTRRKMGPLVQLTGALQVALQTDHAQHPSQRNAQPHHQPAQRRALTQRFSPHHRVISLAFRRVSTACPPRAANCARNTNSRVEAC